MRKEKDHLFWFQAQGWLLRKQKQIIFIYYNLFIINTPFIDYSIFSWTPDEDFSLLLNALKYYDNYCNENRQQFPKIFVIITGKGPEKEMYLEKIGRIKWTNVLILTAWLEAEDYPKVI